MATANPLWGAPRIHGELRTLGVDVSERTVSRLLTPHTRPSSQTWKTFLRNHLATAASMDFFTVPTLTGRVLFVVIVLSHVRRRIEHEVDEVVMESTAQYWRPVWEALEQHWRPQRRARDSAPRLAGTLHLAQAQSNRGPVDARRTSLMPSGW